MLVRLLDKVLRRRGLRLVAIALAVAKKRKEKQKEPVYSSKLKPGEGMEIRVVRRGERA